MKTEMSEREKAWEDRDKLAAIDWLSFAAGWNARNNEVEKLKAWLDSLSADWLKMGAMDKFHACEQIKRKLNEQPK